MRQDLYESDDLVVSFVIDEETDEAWMELRSSPEGPDLSIEDDVVVALSGELLDLETAEPQLARARLGRWPEIEEPGMELMIRVHEWFESWELA